MDFEKAVKNGIDAVCLYISQIRTELCDKFDIIDLSNFEIGIIIIVAVVAVPTGLFYYNYRRSLPPRK